MLLLGDRLDWAPNDDMEQGPPEPPMQVSPRSQQVFAQKDGQALEVMRVCCIWISQRSSCRLAGVRRRFGLGLSFGWLLFLGGCFSVLLLAHCALCGLRRQADDCRSIAPRSPSGAS